MIRPVCPSWDYHRPNTHKKIIVEERTQIMKVTLYKKSGCPWAAAVAGFLNELNVPFEIKNVTTHPQYGKEVENESGRCISPTLDIDGVILADASVEDVARALEKQGVVI